MKILANQRKTQLPDLISDTQLLVGKNILHWIAYVDLMEGLNTFGKTDSGKTEYAISYAASPDVEWPIPLLLDLSHDGLIIQ